MFTQKAIETAFASIKQGSFTVRDVDGTERTFGQGPSEFTVVIKDSNVWARIAKNVSLGFGESYMDGLIDIEGDLHDVVALANKNQAAFPGFAKAARLAGWLRKASGLGGLEKEKQNIHTHYDLGNEFFSLWLDPSMSYSCAYFQKADDTLEKAQEQKIDHLLKKLQLKKGMTLLDIGCGWGWLMIIAAKRYGVRATGLTLSEEQYRLAKERIVKEGLEGLVTVRLANYQELKERDHFDRVVSVGMFEHVGQAHHRAYFEVVNRLLRPGGISVLHTITTNLEHSTDKWIDKYIFPGGYIPSWREVTNLLPEYSFALYDLESLRMHYAMTLDIWAQNYEKHIDKVRAMYDERFVRMWRLYLRGSAASFRTSGLDLHQFVFTKGLNNELPLTRDFLANKD